MEQGLVLVNTGPGKGKTTAALGAALRAAGRGWPVFFLQFVKDRTTGEQLALAGVPLIEFRRIGAGLILKAKDLEPHRRAAAEAMREAQARAASGRYRLLVLDEICVALKHGLLELGEVLDFIHDRPRELSLILTGRDCPEVIMAAADAVTRMEEVKHHFARGVKAREGIEY
ncbi:MAG: cob(I)yrinic acid a,c-diamide adenosyltransferase [Pseudomonadota bacterium]